jgi:hypothetical protein
MMSRRSSQVNSLRPHAQVSRVNGVIDGGNSPRMRGGERSPIARSQSVVSAPLDAFRVGDVLIRVPAQLVPRRLIEVDAPR